MGEPTVGMLFCGWPWLLASGRETLLAGTHSSLKSKNFLGVASVQNCSLPQLITSEPLSRRAGFCSRVREKKCLAWRACLAENV